jgi:hypothetical protein
MTIITIKVFIINTISENNTDKNISFTFFIKFLRFSSKVLLFKSSSNSFWYLLIKDINTKLENVKITFIFYFFFFSLINYSINNIHRISFI